jgi:hypothetical protein
LTGASLCPVHLWRFSARGISTSTEAALTKPRFTSYAGRLNAQRLTLRNGRTPQDQQFILNKASAFVRGLGTEVQAISLTAFCHGLFSEEGAVEAYLRRFAIDGRIKFPGGTGRVQVDGWPELVKVNLEASFLVQGGVFVSWETPLAVPTSEQPPNDLIERSSHALRSAAAAFGLEFEAITP